MIGHDSVGSGPQRIIVLNDWMCDTSTWDGARAYLDRDRFTWAFADLRGYGRSRDLQGEYNVAEAAADVVSLADALGWQKFALVGHSMSTLVALHVAQNHPDSLDRVVLLTPPPPRGFGADAARVESMRGVALGDDSRRIAILKMMWGDRLSEGWIRFKAARWRATSEPAAVADYVAMFARDGVPDPSARVAVPVLAVTGEHDAEPMRRDAVTAAFGPLCDHLVVESLADSGHYPMQEAPPLLVTLVERFLASAVDPTAATIAPRAAAPRV
ncbi:MAG: alpha/beta hydrolase [Byssovorax sp.]